MQENAENMERVYSDLGALQAPRSITYASTLQCCGTLRRYCICVAEYRRGTLHKKETALIHADAQEIEAILAFLYENAITPTALRDILLDLRGQGLLAMEG